MSGFNEVTELPCSSGPKIEGNDAPGKQLSTSNCMLDHIRSVDETSTNEGSVMSENNSVAEQPGSSKQNIEDINQDIVEKKKLDDLASNSSSIVTSTYQYTPYEHLTTHALRFDETAEFLVKSEIEIENPMVYVNTGITHNLISLHCAKHLFKQTKVVPVEKIIESYLPGHHTKTLGVCTLSVKCHDQRFDDVDFFVVDIKGINLVLGNDFFTSKLPELILDVHGPLPPITAYGRHDKVVMNGVRINKLYKLDEVRLDTGCEVNLISSKAFFRAYGHIALSKHEEKHVYLSSLHKCLLLRQCCFVNVEIGSNEYRLMMFYVVDEMSEDMVLGMDFVLNHEQVSIKYDVRKSNKNYKMKIAVKHPVEGYGPEQIEPEEKNNFFTNMFKFLTCSLDNDAESAEVEETEDNDIEVDESAENQDEEEKEKCEVEEE